MRKIRFRFHFLTVPFYCLLFAFLPEASVPYLLPFFLSCAAHEGAHLLVMRLCRVRLLSVSVSPCGVVFGGDFRHISYFRELLCLAAGSSADFIGAGILYMCGHRASAAVWLLTGLYNALPFPLFDGARVLYLSGCLLFSKEETAHAVCRTVSLITEAVLYIFSGWLFFYCAAADTAGKNLLPVGLFFSVCAVLFTQAKERCNPLP